METIEDTINNDHDIGYNNRSRKTKYNSTIHYRKIFQYTIYKTLGFQKLFTVLDENVKYANRIQLFFETSDTECEYIITFLSEFLNNCDNITSIFIDTQSSQSIFIWHTTLLIYRPHLKILEHFDSQCIYKSGNVNIFNRIINSVCTNNNLTYISSFDSHPEVVRNFARPSYVSLNFMCFLSGNYDGIDGWCQMWSLYIMYLIHKYKELSLSQVLERIYSYIRTDTSGNSVERKTRYSFITFNIIRGFFYRLLDMTNSILNPYFHLDVDILIQFDTRYVVNDIRLFNYIDHKLRHYIINEYRVTDI